MREAMDRSPAVAGCRFSETGFRKALRSGKWGGSGLTEAGYSVTFPLREMGFRELFVTDAAASALPFRWTLDSVRTLRF